VFCGFKVVSGRFSFAFLFYFQWQFGRRAGFPRYSAVQNGPAPARQ
jgi:hypothetical protein